MNKVQKSVVTGFTMAITSIFLIIVGNNAFAIEYTNYTSEKLGIQFNYPSDWEIVEKASRFESAPDISVLNLNGSRNINIVILPDPPEALSSMGIQQLTELSLEMATSDFSKEFKTIEDPSVSSINDNEIGSFLITEEDKYEDFPTKYAKQYWFILLNNKLYSTTFISPTTTFDNQDNIEIRNNFIKSLKVMGDNTTLKKTTDNSTSRFD